MTDSSENRLSYPTAVLVDPKSTLFVLDSGNRRIIKWPLGSTFGYIVASIGSMNNPRSMWFSPTRNLTIADTSNHRIISLPITCREFFIRFIFLVCDSDMLSNSSINSFRQLTRP